MGWKERYRERRVMFHPAVPPVSTGPRGTYCTYHQNPLGHPATVSSPFTSDLSRKGTLLRESEARRGIKERVESLSLSSWSPPLPLSSRNIWSFSELQDCTTFNQNHKQSREELCLLLNTVRVQPRLIGSEPHSHPLRMTHLHIHINDC